MSTETMSKTTIPFIFLMMTVSWVMTSCATLTKSQLQLVNNLTVASDSIAVTPRMIFDDLATIRLERGLFYAASLTTATAREQEINALAAAAITDEQLVGKAEVYVNVLNSYLRALRSISNEARWKSYGTEWRGLGRNIDSLLLRTNQTEFLDNDITVGWAKLSGQYMGYLSERYMRRRQAKFVKSFVTEADTLLSTCVDGLVEILKKGDLDALITNESEGLKNNYTSYLHGLESAGTPADISADRRYIELTKRMETVKKTRTRCVSALQSLKKAHKKLTQELQQRQKIDYLFDELIELNTLTLALQTKIEN